MKRSWILLFLMVSSAIMAYGQEKVLESSSKKTPSWVNGVEEGYIVTYAMGKDIDEAKSDLIVKIKNDIVNSVATYVKSSTEITIENVNRDNMVSTLEKFKHSGSIQTADIPFLKGISLSKAEAYYWEKTQNKNTKAISYTYHVKYPFSNAELHRLIMEFNKQDQEMTQKMMDVIESVKTASSIESLEQTKQQLLQLADYYIDVRKEKAMLESKKIDELLQQVDIRVVDNSPGKFVYTLNIGEKSYTTAQNPKFQNAPCITVSSRQTNGMQNELLYNYENCYEDEENYLSFSYKFGNNKISKKYSIDVTTDKVEIFMKDAVRLIKMSENGPQIETFSCHLPIFSKYTGAFTIDKVELEFPGKPILIVNGEKKIYQGEGLHEVNLLSKTSIDKQEYSAINGANINGTIYYTDVKTSEQKSYKVYFHKATTNW
jgi:hypothetical protein